MIAIPVIKKKTAQVLSKGKSTTIKSVTASDTDTYAKVDSARVDVSKIK